MSMHFAFAVLMSLSSSGRMGIQLMHFAIPCSVCMHSRVRECMSDTRLCLAVFSCFVYIMIILFLCIRENTHWLAQLLKQRLQIGLQFPKVQSASSKVPLSQKQMHFTKFAFCYELHPATQERQQSVLRFNVVRP